MGHPRWELADREMGRGIYRRRWDIQGRRIYHMGLLRPELAGRETGRGIYHSRWELAGRETGRGIYRRRWDIRDIQGRRIYHMTWDFQDRNWQVGRREEDLPREVGHPRWEVAGREMGRGIYHSRWELAGRETGRGIYRRRWDTQGGNWQVGRREEEFTAGDGTSGTSKGDEFTT